MSYTENPFDHGERATPHPLSIETEKTSSVNIEWFGNPSQSDFTVIFIPGILDPSNAIAQSFYEEFLKNQNQGDKVEIASMGLQYNEQQPFNLNNVTAEIVAEIEKHDKPVILVGYSFGAFLSLQVAEKLPNPPLGVLLIGPVVDDESVKHELIQKLKKHPTTMKRLLKVAIQAREMLQPTST